MIDVEARCTYCKAFENTRIAMKVESRSTKARIILSWYSPVPRQEPIRGDAQTTSDESEGAGDYRPSCVRRNVSGADSTRNIRFAEVNCG